MTYDEWLEAPYQEAMEEGYERDDELEDELEDEEIEEVNQHYTPKTKGWDGSYE